MRSSTRRRIHVPKIQPGENPLDDRQAHHALNVLRIAIGDTVEVFDDQGVTAAGRLAATPSGQLCVHVDALEAPISPTAPSATIIVASAIPKGDRADWMIEKLSELGVTRFIPLAAERSVVLPTGTNKIDRWRRICIESAKQSHRRGVMDISPLTPLPQALDLHSGAIFGSTETSAPALWPTLATAAAPLHLFIGPEGGWSDSELKRFATANANPIRLTPTILRIETAAITLAAAAALRLASDVSQP